MSSPSYAELRAPKGSAIRLFIEALRDHGVEYAGATHNGGAWPCVNPAHDDDHASMHVTVGRNGGVVLTCSPCKARGLDAREYFRIVVGELGVRLRGGAAVSPDDVEWGKRRADTAHAGSGGAGAKGSGGPFALVATYRYNFADGTENFRIARMQNPEGRKRFRPRHTSASGQHVYSLEGVERTPLYLDHFKKWGRDHGYIWLVEGEKAAQTLAKSGQPATTFHGGANKEPEPGWVERYFDGLEVRCWPDADGPGVAWMLRRAIEVEAARQGRVVGAKPLVSPGWLPLYGVDGAAAKDDAYDALQRGLSAADARALEWWEVEDYDAPKKDDGVNAEDAPVEFGPYPVPITAGLPFAREFVARCFQREGVQTLRVHGSSFWLWSPKRNHYRPVPDTALTRIVLDRLDGAKEVTGDGEVRDVPLTPRAYAPLLQVLRPAVLVGDEWATEMLPSAGGVPFSDGWLDVSTGVLHPLTAERDVRWCVPLSGADISGAAPEWEAFLASIGFAPGGESYRLLRQWFGYVLSGRTDIHKMLLMVGEPRSGKGTIQKVLGLLMGDGAVGFQLDAFDNDHGTAPLAGAALGTVDDARFEGLSRRVVEGMLTASSFGPWMFNAKYETPLSSPWSARIMVATNDTPKFNETSVALANRFVVLNFDTSFLGREDLTLIDRLRAELAQIVGWALEGLADLEREGRFSETRRGRAMVGAIAKNGSSVRLFAEDHVEFLGGGSDVRVTTQDMYEAYKMWTLRQGIMRPATQITFNREFADAFRSDVVAKKLRVGNKVRKVWVGARLIVG